MTSEPPKREILNPTDMAKWLKSEAYQEYTGFIQAVNEAVQGAKISDAVAQSNERIGSLVHLLERLDGWIDEIPPVQQPQRFGNKAFRLWFQKLTDVMS